jgi:lysophospholipase L1-like esterase
MRPPLPLRIGAGVLQPDLDERAVFLNVPDVQGSYTIPYIQTSPHLEISADSSDPAVGCVSLCLSGGGINLKSSLLPGKPSITFRDLPPGEYSLSAVACDCSGASGLELHCERIGVGTVLAAIGDSITEGYFGQEFDWTGDLLAGGFPPGAVSRDGRNFPQFGPTTLHHRGGWKCMQSWMTDLNDMLSAALGRPVFVANEGWGGYKTCDYLKIMNEDHNWQQRMALLEPNVWLIHLGVNDERASRSAEEVGKDLEAIIDLLCHRYQAVAEAIFLARPCYDYAGGAATILSSYCGVIDEIIARRGLSRGPDFFGAYSRDRQRFYSADPVHPNVEGMKHMAALWAEAILCQPRRWDPVQTRGDS